MIKAMKKFVIYSTESDTETGTFTEEQLNDEFGFDEMDVKEIQALSILESTVLSMSMSVVILRVWDI